MYQDYIFRVAKVVADHYGLLTQWVYSVPIFNLFVTSKNETANAPIHELKVRVLRFYFKGLKNIWQHFEFVNLWIGGFVFLMSQTGWLIIWYELLLVLSSLQKTEYLKSIVLICPLTNWIDNHIMAVFPSENWLIYIRLQNLRPIF